MKEFHLLRTFENVNAADFLAVYRESSEENAPEWYPEMSGPEALARYEGEYLAYMRTAFWEEGGLLALLSDDGVYCSALRLYPLKEEKRFFVEALETRPDRRRMGYGTLLFQKLIEQLEKVLGIITLVSNPHKTNLASIATHLSAGFVRTAEYFMEDGVKNEKMTTMVYTTDKSECQSFKSQNSLFAPIAARI